MPSEHSFERADSSHAVRIPPVVIKSAKFAADLLAVIAAIEALLLLGILPIIITGERGTGLVIGYFWSPLCLIGAWAVDKSVRKRLYVAIERAADRPMQGLPRIRRVLLWTLAAVILVGILVWIGFDVGVSHAKPVP